MYILKQVSVDASDQKFDRNTTKLRGNPKACKVMDSKRCITCNLDKALTEYSSYLDKRSNVRRTRNECKSCRVLRESIRNKENPEAHNKHGKTWKDNNKDYVRHYEKTRVRHKRLSDEQFRIKADIVSRTRHFINGDLRTYDDLYATKEQVQLWFQYHLNKCSLAENEWQVDHVIPLSFFDLTDEIERRLATK